jgi:membrane fusion protein
MTRNANSLAGGFAKAHRTSSAAATVPRASRDAAPRETLPARRPLFRQEVIEFQRHSGQWGQVVPLQPLPTRLMVWFVIACMAAIIVFLFAAQYARKERVSGYLTPASGTARIHAPQPGTITALYVEQGQHVEEGQRLLSVTTSRISDRGEDVDATILASLERQSHSLVQQIAAEERRAVSERQRLLARIRSLETEIAQIGAQLALQQERVQVVEALVTAANRLATRGLVSELEHRRREEALLEQRLNLNGLEQQITGRHSELSEQRFALDQLPIVTGERVRSLQGELSSTEQRIAEVNGRRAYIIQAPITGRVSSLQASVGQVADPQRLQLQIVPEDSELQAELFIPTRAIGFVEPGQDVRILYDAFPYQHFGTYRGRIVRVSQTILAHSDVHVPVALTEPAYKAVVELQRMDVDASGKRLPLQPDMLLRADIILERRTLIDWILSPLLSVRLQG